ncbi:PepSY domain-containing protein [Bacillus inaquosorum]|uniref:PepSY-associated TM helix domain-containing protein n=1 Tax=Bacillus inaquosorum TaxID=483913 RepID=UPI0022826C26|nr:PepSY domain-containing protein [Bacillus inaquosorum]MCY7931740.1 PepSY domain-containing protein [Bacillus inaquosorum]MCY8280018.1 PepSY domain-containing protein [Bacillus inaquosorum]MCY8723103.1 PepSY domain-containing protein [Bacillus inaquosorum]MCY8769009.1 PepSY domain-containing protein [Bacillus inaquosorum]MCY9384130.1 PepSY domain-containing protein [Bacillus inaquosorum]
MTKSEFSAFKKKEYSKRKTERTSLYQTIWRWHFYAGLIFLPFLLILAVTGGVYLFKPQIENHLYKDLYEVQAESKIVSPSAQFEAVKERYPESEIVRYRPSENTERSAEVGIVSNNKSYTVFVNPHNGKIIGQLDDDNRIMDKIEEFHGELMAGTAGDRIVELTACWALILIVTGIYLWWPKNRMKVWGVIIPRVSKGKKILTRDLHAVPAFWISAGMLFLVLTGLPWSGLWGNTFQQLATNSGFGYPPSIWVGEAPTSKTQTKEVADVPWAAESLEVPVSSVQQYKKLSIDDVVNIAEEQKVTPGYDIYLPQKTDGVYTLSVFPPKAQDEATMHIDQYTGAVLADYRYDNYGAVGKIIALGITLHKGTQFGLINQLIGLMICIGIVAVGISGFILWWKRKPAGKLGAPKSPELKTMKFLTLIIIMFGILFPLVGISLVLVWIIDNLLIKRISKLKTFFNA